MNILQLKIAIGRAFDRLRELESSHGDRALVNKAIEEQNKYISQLQYQIRNYQY